MSGREMTHRWAIVAYSTFFAPPLYRRLPLRLSGTDLPMSAVRLSLSRRHLAFRLGGSLAWAAAGPAGAKTVESQPSPDRDYRLFVGIKVVVGHEGGDYPASNYDPFGGVIKPTGKRIVVP